MTHKANTLRLPFTTDFEASIHIYSGDSLILSKIANFLRLLKKNITG